MKQGVVMNGIEESAARQKRRRRRRARQEAAWRAKAGPLTVRHVDPDTLR